MPDVTLTNLKQKACYWAFTTVNRDGKPLVSATAVEVKCRWEQSESESVAADGTTIAYPITCHVDREVKPRSIMRLGKLVDLPATPDNLFEVQGCQQVPDLKNRPSKTKYTATLTKFGGKLPPSS